MDFIFISDTITAPLAISYFSISSLGLFFNSMSFVFQGFYTGVEKTRVHLSVTVSSNLINAYLNGGFIYGKKNISSFFNSAFGESFDISFLWFWADFDGLGVSGAARGTLIASIWMVLHYYYYLNTQPMVKENKSAFKVGLNKTML